MGALIVIGDGPEVLNICSGGFLLDAAFTPQRLSELAKTDGAIILAHDASRIARANVHLVPNPNTPTTETGTRHRTAERVARSIGVPVISVSEDMAVLTLYMHEQHQLETDSVDPQPLQPGPADTRAVQAAPREVTANLVTVEVEDLVTVRDVVTLLQRTEIVIRIAEEIERYLVELGTDGRLVSLQLRELMGGVEDDRRMVVLDYFEPDASWNLEHAMETLSGLAMEDLLDPESVAEAFTSPVGRRTPRHRCSPAAIGCSRRCPVCRPGRADHRGVPLPRQAAPRQCGRSRCRRRCGRRWARTIKDSLSHISETLILDRYT